MRKVLKISDLVEKKLEYDLYVRTLLNEGVINYTALARDWLPEIKKRNKDATVGSVSMALRRATIEPTRFHTPKLFARNGISRFTYHKTEATLAMVIEASKHAQDLLVTIDKAITVIGDACETLLTCKPITHTTHLGLVSVEGNSYGHFLNILDRRGVPIVDIVLTTKLNLILKQNDVSKVYRLLQESIRDPKKTSDQC